MVWAPGEPLSWSSLNLPSYTIVTIYAKTIITILTFAEFSGKGLYLLHYENFQNAGVFEINYGMYFAALKTEVYEKSQNIMHSFVF